VKTFWMATAGVCILIAAALIWKREFDTAFIVAVGGVVAWFLNYRIQMKKIAAAAEAERNNSIEEDNHDQV
jgi:hypothetical protein